jgi:hypothetical protein
MEAADRRDEDPSVLWLFFLGETSLLSALNSCCTEARGVVVDSSMVGSRTVDLGVVGA